MNGFTNCPTCLRVVRVANGKICYHVGVTWSGEACASFRADAKWVEKRGLLAIMRNTDGYCMACWQHVSDGPNPDCEQCGLPEDWAKDQVVKIKEKRRKK